MLLPPGHDFPHAGQVAGPTTVTLPSTLSLPAAKQVDDPAAAGVGAWTAQVVQDPSVGAARLLQGVGQDGRVLESAVMVVPPSEGDHRLRPRLRPDGHGAEGDRAEEVAEQSSRLAPPDEVE